MDSFVDYLNFEIIDLPGMNTIGFVVEEGDNNILSLQKIDVIQKDEEGKLKKTFNVLSTSQEPSLIVLITLTNNKAIINTGELTKEGFNKIESNVPLNYGTIYNTNGVEYKEVSYNSDMKRSFCIVDVKTGEELKPNIRIDSETNEIKSTIKIMPHRTYVVLELKK